jgi:hypothetical protein
MNLRASTSTPVLLALVVVLVACGELLGAESDTLPALDASSDAALQEADSDAGGGLLARGTDVEGIVIVDDRVYIADASGIRICATRSCALAHIESFRGRPTAIATNGAEVLVAFVPSATTMAISRCMPGFTTQPILMCAETIQERNAPPATSLSASFSRFAWTSGNALRTAPTSPLGPPETALDTGSAGVRSAAASTTSVKFVFTVPDANELRSYDPVAMSVLLATSPSVVGPADVLVRDTELYVALSGSGSIARCIIETCASSMTPLVSGLSSPTRLAADATHVYWTDFVAGTVSRVPRSGGAVETLVTNVVRPFHVAVGLSDFYYSAEGEPSPSPRPANVYVRPK